MGPSASRSRTRLPILVCAVSTASGSSNWMRLPDFGTDQIPINVPKSYHEANQPMNPGGKLTQTSGEVQGRQMFDRPTWGCINLTYPIFVYGFYGERKKSHNNPTFIHHIPRYYHYFYLCLCVCVSSLLYIIAIVIAIVSSSSSSSSPSPSPSPSPPLSQSPWCLL